MKNWVLSGLVLLFSSFNFMQTKQRIVFFGDSITQQGARNGGYIVRLKEMIKQKGLEDQYELIGAGISGNKIYDLYLRMDSDVLAKNPSTVLIWIGVNDVWHKRTSGTGTDADKFAKFYNAIINKLQARNIKVVICTPACIGEKTDFSNEQDGDLNKYSNIIRDIARKNNCGLIDLRKIFLAYDLANNPDNKPDSVLTRDGVHLNDKGNQLVAEEM